MKSPRRPAGSLVALIPVFVIALICAFAASPVLRAATPAIKARDFPITHAGSAPADYQYVNLTEYFDDLDNPAPQKVRFYFSTGDSIDFILHRDWAPNAHDNFLRYVKALRYDGTAIHRSEYGFVVQGGGYIYNNGTYGSWDSIERFAPAKDDPYQPAHANTRGTIALAKTGEPDSATSEWFINIEDNTTTLAPATAGGNQTNGGFFPFAEIADECVSTYFATGMEFFDWVNYYIGAYQVGYFDTVPVYEGNNNQQYLVVVEAARPTLDFALVDATGNLVQKITGGATEATLTYGNRYLELKGLAGKNDTDTYRIRATAPDGRTATRTLAVNTGAVLSALAGKTIKLTAPALPKTGDDKPKAGAKPHYTWTFTGADGVEKPIAGATKATYAAASAAPYGSGKYTVTISYAGNDEKTVEKTASFIVDFIKKPLQLAAGFAVTPDAPVNDAKGKPIPNTVIGADTTITLYDQNNKQTVVKNVPQGVKFVITLNDMPTGDRPLLCYKWYAGKELLDTYTTTARSDTYYVSADLAARIMYYLRTTKVSINCVVETVATDAKGKPVSTLKTKAVALKTYTVPNGVVITNNADPDNKKNKPVDDGGTVTLSAKAGGSATLSYQWQVFSEGQQKWVNIEDGTDKVTGHSVSGAKKNKLTIKKAYATDTGWYRVVVKNFAGDAYAYGDFVDQYGNSTTAENSAGTYVKVSRQFAPASVAGGEYLSYASTLALTKPVKLPGDITLTDADLAGYANTDDTLRVTANGKFTFLSDGTITGTFSYKRTARDAATVKYSYSTTIFGATYTETGTWNLKFTNFGTGTFTGTGKATIKTGGKSVSASFKFNGGTFTISDSASHAATGNAASGSRVMTISSAGSNLMNVTPDWGQLVIANPSLSLPPSMEQSLSSAAELTKLLFTGERVLRLTDAASGETRVLDFSDGSLQNIVAEDTAEGDVRVTFITQDALGETAAVLILSFGETPAYLLEETRVFIDETGDIGETRKTSAGIFLFE
ncbi:MAG: peptidylprolyl isomerase [Opitutaceae bacterium]|jgi:cyclophilin family peptidyl-prolyl cis-trans isomerase|nr:peptidylprolyl isomerase [Opitutaceae bacterium]